MQQEIDILVNGKPVKQIAHNGRIFIVAKHGTPYEIRLKNNSTSRVLGVASVDGLNVIDGEESKSDGAGYIIHGYGSYTIRGYRTSNDEVHPFVFSSKDQSYANKSDNGDTRDCGVIGVAFHAEKQEPVRYKVIKEKEYVPVPYNPFPWRPHRPWTTEPYWISYKTTTGHNAQYLNSCTSSLGSATMRCATSFDENAPIGCHSLDMGTKFSDESVSDSVVDSEFKIGRTLGTVEIFYASRSVLESMGVPMNRSMEVVFPKAFKGFCRPPRR